ncbi:LutB/LldF family L-lactate oxidation iron-sulfur protein [Desulfogranum japonicum]|uniref:LutB/LldF family L-lactate oxidation iron-sulfur protein n=1 Tax=Desulfogranum japonicum TaxID=231447 RepID=UPI000410ACF1|nr:LutB/LldF family L-lactate oxidation iron-sulfur protein [Desulfogranum japonicum]
MPEINSLYKKLANDGINNQCLQHSLQGLQQRLGKGALNLWNQLPDQQLRARAKENRMQTLEHLDLVLEELAKKIQARGGKVFFASTAEQANDYISKVARQHNVQTVVKGKSMTSAEIGIDKVLEDQGIEVVETDLGEYIVQLAEDTPSHIIAPCIHMDRYQISELFTQKLGIPASTDPPTLTQAARTTLRKKLLSADMGLTGCNLACAETGHITLVSNEGNIRMATTMPPVHVAIMGMERVVATLDEHKTLLQLLTRGASLQKLSTYVSFQGGPAASDGPDGPEEFHLVILDNGRSRILADPDFKEVLACIRCGACLNICPVYGRIGGHAYNSPYSGPIGAVITPLLDGINKHADLCKGETLCGACKDICPVENDLPRMLSLLREKLAHGDKNWDVQPSSLQERTMFTLWAWLIQHPRIYHATISLMGHLQHAWSNRAGMLDNLPGPASKWTRTRLLPAVAQKTFRKRWQEKLSKSKASRQQSGDQHE